MGLWVAVPVDDPGDGVDVDGAAQADEHEGPEDEQRVEVLGLAYQRQQTHGDTQPAGKKTKGAQLRSSLCIPRVGMLGVPEKTESPSSRKTAVSVKIAKKANRNVARCCKWPTEGGEDPTEILAQHG